MLKTQNSDVEEKRIKDFFSILGEVFNETSQEFSNSSYLASLDIEDSLFKEFKEAIKNPFDLLSSNYILLEKQLLTLLNEHVKNFFKLKRNLIQSVYQSKSNGSFLYYFIVLKRDSLSNRGKFYDFLHSYEITPISSRLQIEFDFVSESEVEDLQKVEKVEF